MSAGTLEGTARPHHIFPGKKKYKGHDKRRKISTEKTWEEHSCWVDMQKGRHNLGKGFKFFKATRFDDIIYCFSQNKFI